MTDIPETAHDLLGSIFTVATELVRGERASLLLRDEDEAHFVIAMARGIADEVRRHARVREGEGVAGRVAATKRALLVRHAEPGRSRGTYRTDSFVSVPILVDDRAQGVLSVTERADGAPFEDADLETLQLLASHIATCLVRQRLDDQLRELAETDALTRLFNRRYFDRALRAEVDRTRRGGGPLALLMLDVNALKDVNDALGHSAGDEVLRIVADAMRRALRTYDVPVRYGGDEFAVILPNADAASAGRVGERILTAVAAGVPTATVAAAPSVGLSIGVATLPPADDAARLVERADAAMYEAKAARGGVSLWDAATPSPPAGGARRAGVMAAPYLADPGRLANPALQALLPTPLAEEWNALVIGREGRVLTVVLAEPSRAAVEALSSATGYAIYPVYSAATDIERARRAVSVG